MDFNPVVLQNLLDLDLSKYPFSPAAGRLQQEMYSKWIETSTDADDEAIKLFRQMNFRCRNSFNLDLNRDFIYFAKARSWTHFQTPDGLGSSIDIRQCFDVGRAGPGSSRRTKFTDFFRKMFIGPLSSDSIDLYKIYKYTISDKWQRAELNRSQSFAVDIVEGSKLSLVPKSKKISRTICTEPTVNMFAQLGAGRIIEEKLKRFYSIDLRFQPDINRSLAKTGSINGEYATIDLKSASDTISIDLVKAILPPDVFSTLDQLRSKCVEMPNGEILNLNMMSTMGNGFTFPLQTYIFALISEYIQSKYGMNDKINVFGDDIICRKNCYDDMVTRLTDLGFIVNAKKSFNSGPFRESCGHDYNSGINIRSIYIRRIINDQDLFSAINRINSWSSEHSIYLPRTVTYLYKFIKRKLFVPLHEGDTAGLRCPLSFLEGTLRFDRNGKALYKLYTPIDVEMRVNKQIVLNPDAALISYIGGYIRKGKLRLRRNSTIQAYKVTQRSTPYWDYTFSAGLTRRDFENTWFIHMYSNTFDSDPLES